MHFRCTFHTTVYDVLRARGWKETDSETDWDVAWVDTGWIREHLEGVHLDEGAIPPPSPPRELAALQYMTPPPLPTPSVSNLQVSV